MKEPASGGMNDTEICRMAERALSLLGGMDEKLLGYGIVESFFGIINCGGVQWDIASKPILDGGQGKRLNDSMGMQIRDSSHLRI